MESEIRYADPFTKSMVYLSNPFTQFSTRDATSTFSGAWPITKCPDKKYSTLGRMQISDQYHLSEKIVNRMHKKMMKLQD